MINNTSPLHPLSSIGKPYIFHRPNLLNTEIIITISTKCLKIFTDFVGTVGKTFSVSVQFAYQVTSTHPITLSDIFCPDTAILTSAIYIIANNYAPALHIFHKNYYNFHFTFSESAFKCAYIWRGVTFARLNIFLPKCH